MRFHAWKRHEIIVWNHMVPCMESHGRLMNLDPGNVEVCVSMQAHFTYMFAMHVHAGPCKHMFIRSICVQGSSTRINLVV